MPATDDRTQATLGDLALDFPDAVRLFELLGLDYCCGGRRSLDEACAQRGLDAATVIAMLEAADRSAGPDPERHDIARASITELCDHIVVAHHQPQRTALHRAAELLATVVRVHGETHRELVDLQRLFGSMRAELEDHMGIEEAVMFPACRALDAGSVAAAFDAGLLVLLEDDHETTGQALCALRELSDGYRPERALCGTHRALLDALRAIELDLHQHVHEENNVLFPRVRARIGSAPRSGRSRKEPPTAIA